MTTDELIETLSERAIVEIKETELGIIFKNADGQEIGRIPFAGTEEDKNGE